jgi:hypothetical protein
MGQLSAIIHRPDLKLRHGILLWERPMAKGSSVLNFGSAGQETWDTQLAIHVLKIQFVIVHLLGQGLATR